MSLESITLNNIHFGNTFNVWKGSDSTGLFSEQFMPENEVQSESVLGQNGAYFFNQIYKPRVFNIPLFGEHLTKDMIKKLQQTLSFNTPKKLIYDTSPHKFIWVNINGEIDWRYVWTQDKYYNDLYNVLFELPLIALDPFYYSYYTSLDNYDYYNDIHSVFAQEAMDFGNKGIPSNIITNITSGTNFDIYNHGNMEAQLIIGLKGSGKNINIINNNTSKQCIISNMVNEGILINGQKGQITDGEIVNGQIINVHSLKTGLFDGDFIELQSGYNNFSITGTDLDLQSVSFLFRHTYI